MKYKVISVDSQDKWDVFVMASPEGSIFATSAYLSSYANIQKFFILKGESIVAAIYLPCDDTQNVISAGYLIHSGILFEGQKDKTNSKYNIERYEITEFFVEYLTDNFGSIALTLHPGVVDIRPFLWHNYHEPQLEHFSTTMRYTSYVDISDVSNADSKALFAMDAAKRRFIRQGDKEDLKISTDFDIDLMRSFHRLTMGEDNEDYSADVEAQIITIMEQLHAHQMGMQVTVYRDGVPTYTTFFSLFKNMACYLFGAGDVEKMKNNDATYCFWRAFLELNEKSIDLVDMEGINSPKRAIFKIRFGGNIVPYYSLKYTKVHNA